jgi:gas vesicle protein GvpL/GvpF
VTASQLCYVYAVLPPGAGVPGVAGVVGDLVTAVVGPGFALAVGDVPADDFGAGRLEERLEDPDLATKLAVEHFRVVSELFAAGPVLPARMCTLFSSPERALAGFSASAAGLCAALDLVTGCAQWSVRVSAPRQAAGSGAGAASGADYLARVAAARRQAIESDAAAEAAGAQVLDGLARYAVDQRPAAAAGTGRAGKVIIGADFLVPAERAESFLAAANAGATGGITIDVRGPWPPYSFVPPLEQAA